jgi:two-component system response regulator HydG
MDLLRVLQERRFFRLGGTEEIPMEARIIAATNRNLQEAVEKGDFREDLFYRLNVINIRLPSLCERREDIPLLVNHFIERLALEAGKQVRDVSKPALKLLMDHDWPGNVRELENTVERAIVTARSETLDVADFDFLMQSPRGGAKWNAPDGMSLAEIEKHAVESVLDRTGGNIKLASEILGVDRSTLYAMVRRHNIPR